MGAILRLNSPFVALPTGWACVSAYIAKTFRAALTWFSLVIAWLSL